ncbi:hypothetical protein H4219_004229 [Mycoemilia scoparia]|uniref:Uncharacterized protein n=1 Tax=Mycoemilia scoparia TaxID=417184 RepID=A0A9W7ZSC9_9FUNG|nr:hypothetical protein H4219_004229 [Mycoemilia scoparia]
MPGRSNRAKVNYKEKPLKDLENEEDSDWESDDFVPATYHRPKRSKTQNTTNNGQKPKANGNSTSGSNSPKEQPPRKRKSKPEKKLERKLTKEEHEELFECNDDSDFSIHSSLDEEEEEAEEVQVESQEQPNADSTNEHGRKTNGVFDKHHYPRLKQSTESLTAFANSTTSCRHDSSSDIEIEDDHNDNNHPNATTLEHCDDESLKEEIPSPNNNNNGNSNNKSPPTSRLLAEDSISCIPQTLPSNYHRKRNTRNSNNNTEEATSPRTRRGRKPEKQSNIAVEIMVAEPSKLLDIPEHQPTKMINNDRAYDSESDEDQEYHESKAKSSTTATPRRRGGRKRQASQPPLLSKSTSSQSEATTVALSDRNDDDDGEESSDFDPEADDSNSEKYRNDTDGDDSDFSVTEKKRQGSKTKINNNPGDVGETPKKRGGRGRPPKNTSTRTSSTTTALSAKQKKQQTTPRLLAKATEFNISTPTDSPKSQNSNGVSPGNTSILKTPLGKRKNTPLKSVINGSSSSGSGPKFTSPLARRRNPLNSTPNTNKEPYISSTPRSQLPKSPPLSATVTLNSLKNIGGSSGVRKPLGSGGTSHLFKSPSPKTKSTSSVSSASNMNAGGGAGAVIRVGLTKKRATNRPRLHAYLKPQD